MFLTNPATAAHEFQLALTGIGVISAFLIALVVVLCRRTDRKFDALVAELLALPPERLDVWVSSHVYEVDSFEYTGYSIFYRIAGKDPVQLTDDDLKMKYACRTFAAAGRPVRNAPSYWLNDPK